MALVDLERGPSYDGLSASVFSRAEVAELADALRSGRSPPCEGRGSNPRFGTKICDDLRNEPFSWSR